MAPALVVELVQRGIPESLARKLLLSVADGQEVIDQLEWGDYWIRQNSGSKIVNPTGFYIYLIKENVRPPETFETSRRKALAEEAKRKRDRQIYRQATLERDYEAYRTKVVDGYIAENYSNQGFQKLIERKRQELLPRYRQIAYWKPETLKRFLDSAVRSDLEKELFLPTFEKFVAARAQAKSPENGLNEADGTKP
jgi:hypothetical protein